MLSIGQILAFTAAALATFIAGAGSAKGVGRAAVEDLVKVEGVSEALAVRIHGYFRK